MLEVKDIPNADILQKFASRYPEADISNVLGFLKLLRVGADLSIALNDYLAEFELLQGRWWVLLLLMREKNLTLTPSLLAEKAGVTRATMSGLLEGLLRENLVSRVACPMDRRQVQIRLTPSGQAKLDEIMPGYYRRVNHLMNTFSQTEMQQLTDLLHKLSQQTF